MPNNETESLMFDSLLEDVMREENAAAQAPAGLEQRLAARFAHEHERPIVNGRPFAFA